MFIKSMKVPGIACMLAIAITLSAQETFELTYGSDVEDYGHAVQQTPDNGYIVAGMTGIFGGGVENYLVRTDDLGDTLWTKTFGIQDQDDIATCVQLTTDQGYILAGYVVDINAPSNVVVRLIKFDSYGEQAWAKTFNKSVRQYAYSVKQTSDKGYIIAGSVNLRIMGGTPQDQYDVLLIKTDSSGNEQWTRTYQNRDQSHGYCVQQTSDGGYVIAGLTGSYSEGIYDIYLIKTDPSGDTLWTKTYGGSGFDEAKCVLQTSGDGYLLAGHTDSYGRGEKDITLIRTNSSGSMLWTSTYGGQYDDYCTALSPASDEGYIIAGYTESYGAGGNDAYLVRTNVNGDTLWTRTFGGSGNDVANSVQQAGDGGYIVAGTTNSKGAGSTDVYLIKTNENGVLTDIGESASQGNPGAFSLSQNIPNPFSTNTVISYQLPVSGKVDLSIYNNLGQKVVTLVSEKQPAGTYQLEWDAGSFEGGVYFYRLETNTGYSQSRKLILSK